MISPEDKLVFKLETYGHISHYCYRMNILAIIAVVLLCVGFTNQDETQTEISESTQTSPLLSLQMFRNGSVQLIEPLLGNTSNTGHDSIQYDNQTLENQIRSRER